MRSVTPQCGQESEPMTEPPCVVATPGVARAIASAPSPGVTLKEGDGRPWQQKWREVLRLLERLREAYAGGVGDSTAVRQLVNGFFLECDHLVDWMMKDPAFVMKRTATQDIYDYAHKRSVPLQLCDAMCNTDKHRTRRSGHPTAEIDRLDKDPSGTWAVSLKVDWPARPRIQSRDALRLAEGCVSAWRTYFKRHNIPGL